MKRFKKCLTGLVVLLLLAFSPVIWAQDIDGGEYFFDTDPGTGNGIAFSTPVLQDATTSFSVDITGLSAGIHTLFVRTRNEANVWSLTNQWPVFKLPVISTTPEIVQIEYFFNTDPGLGNGNQVSGFTPSEDINAFSFPIDISGLSIGLNQLFVRTRNNNGEWSLTASWLIAKLSDPAAAINITEAEYFWNTDPGLGNGTDIPVTASPDVNGLSFSADMSALPLGLNQLFVRTRDENGVWSHTSSWLVGKMPDQATPINITDAEYFWNTDPGLGNGTDIPVIASPDVNGLSFSADMSALPLGMNQLYVRTKDENGVWSHTARWLVFKLPDPSATIHITDAEYYWNTDPGFGNGNSIPVTPGADVNNLSFSADMSTLPLGINQLFVRTKDENGVWSHTGKWLVCKLLTPADQPEIVAAEYFIDDDPGLGQASPISLTPGLDISNISFSADLTGLPIGPHKLFVRTQDANGVWSLSNIHDFIGGDYPQAPGSGTALNLNASNDQVTVPDDPSLQFGAGGDFMVECWVKVNNAGDGIRDVAVSKWNDFSVAGTNEWALTLSSDGNNTIPQFIVENGNSQATVTGSYELEVDKWYHLAGVKWGDEILFFVNGVSEGTAFVGGINFNITSEDVIIGNSGSGNNDADAMIDEVRIWSRNFFDDAIRDWMCKKVTPAHPNYSDLVSYYRFDENAGTQLIDVKGPNTGALINTTGWEVSGAPIGDESAWDYTDPIDVSIAHPDGDGLTATITSGTPFGAHVYRIDEAPNVITEPADFTDLLINRYYGVFVAGGTNPEYTMTYDFTGSGYAGDPQKIQVAKRDNNADPVWENTNGIANIGMGTITKEGEAGTEYILGEAVNCSVIIPFDLPGADTVRICDGDNAIIIAPGGFTNYLWSTGETTQSVTALTTDDYGVTATNASGCSASDVKRIEINANPVANVMTSGPTILCQGETVTLTANAGTGFSYLWTNGATSQNITVSNQGSYWVTVTNDNNCSEVSVPVVVQIKNPLADFIGGPLVNYLDAGNPTADVTFTPSTNGTISSFEWSFGNGGTAATPNPMETYDSPGFYDVQLIVEDDTGCRDTLNKPGFVQVWQVFPNTDISIPGITVEVTGASFISSTVGYVSVVSGNGGSGGGTVYQTLDGGMTWTEIIGLGTGDFFNNIIVLDGVPYAVGTGGHLCYHNGSWQFVPGFTQTLYDIWFGGPNYGWVVGAGGLIINWNGSTWTPFSFGTQPLYAVYGVGPGNAWAVGGGGTIWYYNGSVWTQQVSGVSVDLNGVYFVNNLVGWAVGNGGTILYTNDGGVTWTIQGTGFPYNLNGIYCIDSQNAIVVGDNGVVWVTTNGGMTWELFSVGTVTNLLDVTVNNCIGYITGEDGNVYQFQFPGCSPVLPIELLEFKATEDNGNVKLDWVTENEINSRHFEIEHAPDAINFTNLGTIEAAGFSNQPLSYQFVDSQPKTGANYYRLKLVDQDGSFQYSNVEVVVLRPSDTSITLKPSLVSGSTTLEIETEWNGKVDVIIYDNLGQQVNHFDYQTSEGLNRFELDFSVLTPGIYYMGIIQNGEVQTLKFVKL
ncbi:MAG: LamG-like jellyroll fold domain-containing protein [Bacteroidota bacterium]